MMATQNGPTETETTFGQIIKQAKGFVLGLAPVVMGSVPTAIAVFDKGLMSVGIAGITCLSTVVGGAVIGVAVGASVPAALSAGAAAAFLGIVAGIATVAGVGAISVGAGVGAGIAAVASITTGCIAADRIAQEEACSFKKVLAGALTGVGVSAAMSFASAAGYTYTSKMPASPVAPEQESVLKLETRGGALCKDFTFSESGKQTDTKASPQDKGLKTYTLTIPAGCTLVR